MMLVIALQSSPSPIQGYFIGFGFIISAIALMLWWKTRCVRCQRPFAKVTLKKKKRGRGIMDSITGTRHEFYQCKYCSHEWDKVVRLDGE